MVDTFVYRPRFIDIRVNKAAKAQSEAQTRTDGQRACDHVGCPAAGLHRAPKGRGRDNDWWWFCAEHAGDYNRRWNYFAGMTDDELREYEEAERAGHRPTWTFRAARGDRLSAVYRNADRADDRGRRQDPFGFFRDSQAASRAAPKPRHLGRLQRLALEAMGLDEAATPDMVRARYAELVKRYHPDSNGGDRAAEAQLQKVLRAYQTLKSAKLA